MSIDDIIGQKEMWNRLKGLADEGRLPHAMLLCGQDGVGKMALAMSLASYLLGDGSYKMKGMRHPDLHFTFPTIKLTKWKTDYKPTSDDFIEEWHEMLKEGAYFSLTQWMTMMGAERQQAVITVGEANELLKKLQMKANQGGWKVSIVWLPERMNLDCANKMLKLIEEPPSKTLFIMVSREPEGLLETIRSRVQRFEVKPIEEEDIVRALMERRMISEGDARHVARLADGSWTKALEELNTGNENRLFFDYFVTLMRKAYQRDVKDLKRWSENVATMGREEQKRLLGYMLRMAREAFVYNFGDSRLQYMTTEEEEFCRRFARFVNEGNILGFQELFQRATRDIGQNANPKMVFFDITMTVAVLLHTT